MANTPDADARRRIPRTDALLADPVLAAAVQRLSPAVVRAAIHAAQEAARAGRIPPEAVTETARAALPDRATSLQKVINATGVVVHTNLGRAPLSPAAVDALVTASSYVDVEWDAATGTRSRRGRGAMAALAAAVPEAEAVFLVNNGAAALALAATALAAGREIVVSRGELVEIGDGFRLPDLLVSTGARLREVGTTNRTSRSDYAAAIGPDTGMVLKVHPSNFCMTGFTSDVGVADLSGLGPPVVVDIGSGLLRPEPALPREPDAASALIAGADLVTGSGDKLLGGPQAGLLLGRRELVEGLRRHPLARALRVDKLTLAAMEATLRGPVAPVVLALRATESDLHDRAAAMADALGTAGIGCDIVPSEGVVGGGGGPGVTLPGWAVALPEPTAEQLRVGDPCVATRVESGRCLVDLRSLAPDLDPAVCDAVVDAIRRLR